jgi:hypothetical protein
MFRELSLDRTSIKQGNEGTGGEGLKSRGREEGIKEKGRKV